MKRLWRVGAVISTFVLFCTINICLEAIDLSGAYQRAKNAANSAVNTAKSAATSVVDKAKSAANSAVDTAKNAANSVVDTAKNAVTYAKETINGTLSNGVKAAIGSEQTAIRLNPYKNTVATVRIGNALHPDERAYLVRRKPKVKAALEKMLGRSLNDSQVPTIAIVGSGGGYRAMLGMIGSLLGAEKIGILDSTTYMTALSGATWAVAPWISTGMSLSQLKNYIMQNITKDIHVSSINEAKNILDMLSVKLVFDEPITIVDIYGGLLANRLLSHYGNDCQRVYLSQQVQRIQNADVPYPIYTAIDAREAVAGEPHWFEFTPHEIGSPYFGVYVPTWAYGRKFNNGQSINFAPEQSLGFQMGTFGSAFGVHFGRVWDEIIEKFPGAIIKPAVQSNLIDPLTGKRINSTWATIFNFTYGMANQELKARETIKFVDAGVDFNLPYSPVSGERPERKADIMFFLDFSGGSLLYSLKKTEDYARRKGLKFPKIDYAQIETKSISVFKDATDTSVPVVIYLPRVSEKGLWDKHKSNSQFNAYNSIEGFDFTSSTNGGFADTHHFQYTHQQSQQLIDQMEFNVMVNKDQIIEVIKGVVDRKGTPAI